MAAAWRAFVRDARASGEVVPTTTLNAIADWLKH
jgi:hypothetical protein